MDVTNVFDPKTITDLIKANGCAKHTLSGSTEGVVRPFHAIKTSANNGG